MPFHLKAHLPTQHSPLAPLPPLHIGNSTLQRAREINMKQRPVKPVHDRHLGRRTLGIRFTRAQAPSEIRPAAIGTMLSRVGRGGDVVLLVRFTGSVQGLAGTACVGFFDIPCSLPFQRPLILYYFGSVGRTVLPTNFRDGENRLPALEHWGVGVTQRGRVPEACARQGAFGPAVVDAGEVPVYFVRGGIAVELVAHID